MSGSGGRGCRSELCRRDLDGGGCTLEAGLDDVEGMGETRTVGGQEGCGQVFEGSKVETEETHALFYSYVRIKLFEY